ncbi:hypothetical protein [Liquorilactobacillus mali]|uniref:Uncharacterized protein n=1 Tax=Liquorilactobacillus mali TaxID=1618 RepID=A0A0R2FQQ7_9LACO|nr:hypothetical protein [Liquorilactobacillus mali]KRN27372.1 hypothetical protein IV36_GL000981 [Liquorilactobacillus mali]
MIKEKSYVAFSTLFNEDDSLNVGRTIQHVKYLNQHEIKSILLSGKQYSFSNNEKFELINTFDHKNQLSENFELIFGISNIRQKYGEELGKFI